MGGQPPQLFNTSLDSSGIFGDLSSLTLQSHANAAMFGSAFGQPFDLAAAIAAAGQPPIATQLTTSISSGAQVLNPASPGAVQVGMMLSGSVKRWDAKKGFGFIVPAGGGPDVFIHATELAEGETLVNGMQVMFEAMMDHSKGPGRYRAKTCIGGIQKDAAPTQASDRLFMTGFPSEITEEEITSVFAQYGQVTSVKKLPTQAGKSDAAALVKMGEVAQAQWLVDNVSRNIPTGLTTPVTIIYAENKAPGGGVIGGDARSAPY